MIFRDSKGPISLLLRFIQQNVQCKDTDCMLFKDIEITVTGCLESGCN